MSVVGNNISDETQFCTQCEGKTYQPSDEGLCAWCFDNQEED